MGGNVSLGKAWGGHSREGEHQGPKVARLVDIECSQLIVNSAAWGAEVFLRKSV